MPRRGASRSSAQLHVLLGDEPLQVLADATQVEQVLMNLCTNAWQALRGSSGRIGVTLDIYESEAPDGLAAGFGVRQPGRYAHVTFSDNGSGVDAETLQRVFEPFFTTKSKGEGTGLGLAVAHGIIAEHCGALTVHSTPGKGTRFELLLPLVDGSCRKTQPYPPRPCCIWAAGLQWIRRCHAWRAAATCCAPNGAYTSQG